MSHAYALDGNQLPPLPDDVPMPQMPPPPFNPQQQFGMNGGQRPADGIPKFFVKPVRLPDGKYVNVEMVEILTPGDPKARPVHKVTDGTRQRYAQYYQLWKNEQVMAPTGTPIEMWPRMTPALVHQLKAVNIFTVEQLSACADSNLGNIPFGKTLRNEAQTWLEAKKDADAISKAAAETQAMRDGMQMLEEKHEAESKSLREDNADLRRKLDALLERMAAPGQAAPAPAETDATPRRGPGRSPKAAEAA